MKLCITGVAGFVGSRLAAYFRESIEGLELCGIDNLGRRGSETNLAPLAKLGCTVYHGDIRSPDDVGMLPRVDWVVDCAAIPSVMAGLAGDSASLVAHNLIGSLHLLEKCRRDVAGFLMLSTSRVYSIPALAELPLRQDATRFALDVEGPFPIGSSPRGIAEEFSTSAPVSLYGATKLASEVMALEYGSTYGFPVWVNRCGVIAGAGQFGKIDQGVVSFWIYQWLLGRPLAYIGFGGTGKQVRDFLAPEDLGALIVRQLQNGDRKVTRVCNVGGGQGGSTSLSELSHYCEQHFGTSQEIMSSPSNRPFDIPYYVTDNTLVESSWGWRPATPAHVTLDAIARWAHDHRSHLEAGF